MPLRVALWLGVVVSLAAVAFGAYVIGAAFVSQNPVPGWNSLAADLVLRRANLFTTGIIGLYVGRIHNEAKQRPLYVVRQEIGFAREAAAETKPSLYRRRKADRAAA